MTLYLHVCMSNMLFINLSKDFMVMPDALGITHISDLSQGDMDKVRSVALVELTITFEDHNITLRPRRQAKLKSIPG